MASANLGKGSDFLLTTQNKPFIEEVLMATFTYIYENTENIPRVSQNRVLPIIFG